MTDLMESVLGHTRQQLAQAMAANAELSALLAQAQEKIESLEKPPVSGDNED
jgi:hypothetical protein